MRSPAASLAHGWRLAEDQAALRFRMLGSVPQLPLNQCLKLAAGVGLVGTLALVCDWLQGPRAVLLSLHSLFALMCLLATGRLLLPALQLQEQPLRALFQQVSRGVYLFVYSLVGVRLALHLLDIGHPVTEATQLAMSDSAGPIDDFQFYALCCLAPLWLIRAGVLWHRGQRLT